MYCMLLTGEGKGHGKGGGCFSLRRKGRAREFGEMKRDASFSVVFQFASSFSFCTSWLWAAFGELLACVFLLQVVEVVRSAHLKIWHDSSSFGVHRWHGFCQ